jgi:hypothetical protein
VQIEHILYHTISFHIRRTSFRRESSCKEMASLFTYLLPQTFRQKMTCSTPGHLIHICTYTMSRAKHHGPQWGK